MENGGGEIWKNTTEMNIAIHNNAFLTTLDKLKYIFRVYFIGLLCIGGLICNYFIIAVLRRHHSRLSATNHMLRSLAIVDSLFLITTLFIYPITGVMVTMGDPTSVPFTVYNYVMRFMLPMPSIQQTLAVWLMLLLSVNRYKTAVNPLGHRTQYINRANVVVIVMVFCAVVYHLPEFFEYKIVSRCFFDDCKLWPHLCHVCNGTGYLVTTLEFTSLHTNKIYQVIYHVILDFVFRSIVPMTILIYLLMQLKQIETTLKRSSQFIGSKPELLLTQHSQEKDTNTSQQCDIPEKPDRFIDILSGILMLFVICQLPDAVIRFVYAILKIVFQDMYKTLEFLQRVMGYLVPITTTLLLVNSSLKIVVFCMKAPQFRSILKTMCCYPYKFNRNRGKEEQNRDNNDEEVAMERNEAKEAAKILG